MNREFNLGSTPSAQKCEFNKFYTQSLTFKQIFVKLFSNLTSKQLFFKQKQIFSMLCFLKSKIARNHQHQQYASSTSASSSSATRQQQDQSQAHQSPTNINAFQISSNASISNHDHIKNLEQDFLSIINLVLVAFGEFSSELRVWEAKSLVILKQLIGKHEDSPLLKEMMASQKERIKNVVSKQFSQLKGHLLLGKEKSDNGQSGQSNLNYKLSNLLIFTKLNQSKNGNPFYLRNQVVSFSEPSDFHQLPGSSQLWSKNSKSMRSFPLPAHSLITNISSQQFDQVDSPQSNKILIQKLCRILNRGKGQIYIGVKESEGEKQSSNCKMESDSGVCKSFVIEGVLLKMRTCEHEKLLAQTIEILLCKNVKNLNPKWSRLVESVLGECLAIEYIPVFDSSFIQNFENDELRGTFVIKVKLNFTKYFCQQLFYLDDQSQQSPIFFTQTPSLRFNEHNHLIVSQLYTQILRKYRTNKNLSFQQHSQFTCFGFVEQIINQSDKYLDVSSLSKQSHEILEKQQTIKQKEHLKQMPTKAGNKQESSMKTFGRVPIKFFNHSTVVLVRKEQYEKKSFHLQIEALLKQRKMAFQMYTPYEDLEQMKVSQRYLFFLNHQKKHDLIKKLISSQLDKENRYALLNEVRNQFELVKWIHFDDAIKTINFYFRQRYPKQTVFKTFEKWIIPEGKQKQELRYFWFDEWQKAVFAFFVLEYKSIKCSFVNLKKLQDSIIKEHSLESHLL